jgi:uncharacterized RDD family membrane protein YckC
MSAFPQAMPGETALVAPALRRRLACLVYETLIVLGLALATAAIVVFTLHAFGMDRQRGLLRTTIQAAEFAAITLYASWFWSAGRQTLPMKVWGLRIVTAAGRPLSFARAFARALLAWLWVLPAFLVAAAVRSSPHETGLLLCGWVLLWAGLSLTRRDRQYLHDALAGTRVISVPR